MSLVVGVWLASSSLAGGAELAFLGRTSDQWITRLQSSQPQERTEAAWALALIAERHPPFANQLASHDDATVRYWGMQGLQRVALSKQANPAVIEAATPRLHSGLSDAAPAVRIAAAEALGLAGNPEAALPVIIEAMSHPQEAVRVQAVAALANLGAVARPAEKTLRGATTDSSEYVKRIATRALQKLDQ